MTKQSKSSVGQEKSISGGAFSRRRLLQVGAGLGLAQMTGILPAFAAGYPERQLSMIHAFAPGSSTDAAGRLIADALRDRLGQPVVVENKPGANTIIGTDYAARQPADGYTLLMVTIDSLCINPALYEKLPYSVTAFDPLTMVGFIPLVLVGSTKLPDMPLQELFKQPKAMQDGLDFGTWGQGSVAHLVGEMIRQETGANLVYVPFQGAAPSNMAVQQGTVDFAVLTPQSAAQLVASGKVRIYALGGEERSPIIPDVPTFKELGLGNVKAVQWHGVAVRAGGNRQIIDRLYGEVSGFFKQGGVEEKFTRLGYQKLDGRSPQDFAKLIAEQTEIWGRAVKATGLRRTL